MGRGRDATEISCPKEGLGRCSRGMPWSRSDPKMFTLLYPRIRTLKLVPGRNVQGCVLEVQESRMGEEPDGLHGPHGTRTAWSALS